jgi:cytochrome d ubiquinol oxidase subunit I
MFSMAMWMAAIVAPIQVFIGDMHGLNTMEHQPQKVMAMEGHYESHPEGWAPLYLFGIPNDAEQRLDYAVGIPGASSLILKHSLTAPLAGLDTIPDDEQPPVGVVFWSFRIMVGIGFMMVALGGLSLLARWRGMLFTNRPLLRFAVAMGPSGLVAVLAGWVTTEVGRQPYTIWGLLRTADSAAPLDASAVGVSLMAFVVVYFIVFGAGTFYVLRLMSQAPATRGARGWEEVRGPIRSAGIAPGPAQGPPMEQGPTDEDEEAR